MNVESKRPNVNSPSLDRLGLKHGTDKASSGHGYLGFYERFLAEMRDQHMRVLEIGVREGASVRMWEEFFPNATIVAIDIDPACRQHAGGRITVEMVDQSDVTALTDLARAYGPFGLVVDDGSHMWEHQITSLRQLYPHVQPGGSYILEDLDTSYGLYEPMFRGISRVRASDYLQKFCDHVAAGGQLNPEVEEDAFIRSCAPITEFVALSRGTSILRRAAA